jgi:hypothetical protein
MGLEKPIIIGSLAGAIGYVGTLPLDLIKQHLQSNRDTKQVYKNIYGNVQSHGYKYLFKGGMLGCYSIVPQMAIKFTINDFLIRNTNNSSYFNGFISGYLDGTFLGPVLSMIALQQMKKSIGYQESFKLLISGPIFPLTIPLAMRNAIYTSVLFGGHKSFNQESNFLNNFTVSSILNVPGVLLCSPFDVIRAHQINNMLNKKSLSPLYIANNIYIKNGFKGFYQGLGSLYINFALRFPITFSIFYGLNDIWTKKFKN